MSLKCNLWLASSLVSWKWEIGVFKYRPILSLLFHFSLWLNNYFIKPERSAYFCFDKNGYLLYKLYSWKVSHTWSSWTRNSRWNSAARQKCCIMQACFNFKHLCSWNKLLGRFFFLSVMHSSIFESASLSH